MVRGQAAAFWPILSSFSQPNGRNIIPDHALLLTVGVGQDTQVWNEAPMATREHHQIIETPTEARQAEPGPSVLALLTASTGLAVLILGILWFAFFHS
jgi:hypothetical protein